MSRHELAKVALQRLFPRLENMGDGGDWISRWDAERRVCIEALFDTYFRLTLSDETLPTKIIEEMAKRADDADFLKATMRTAAKAIRRTGKSMVPVYLDELTTHAAHVDKGKVTAFLGALFEFHDEIDLDVDSERDFGGMANTSLRYHWLLRRVTAERFTPEERSNILVAAIQNAALGWLVDFHQPLAIMRRNGSKVQSGTRIALSKPPPSSLCANWLWVPSVRLRRTAR